MQTFQDDIMKLKILIRELEEKHTEKIIQLEKRIEYLEQKVKDIENQTKK